MESERREQERNPSFTAAELVAAARTDEETVYPLMIGDRGPSGIGGVYLGQEQLEPGAEFILREEESAEQNVRLVWMKQVAKYVCLIGLETLE